MTTEALYMKLADAIEGAIDRPKAKMRDRDDIAAAIADVLARDDPAFNRQQFLARAAP